jgi:hypothetical protein
MGSGESAGSCYRFWARASFLYQSIGGGSSAHLAVCPGRRKKEGKGGGRWRQNQRWRGKVNGREGWMFIPARGTRRMLRLAWVICFDQFYGTSRFCILGEYSHAEAIPFQLLSTKHGKKRNGSVPAGSKTKHISGKNWILSSWEQVPRCLLFPLDTINTLPQVCRHFSHMHLFLLWFGTIDGRGSETDALYRGHRRWLL